MDLDAIQQALLQVNDPEVGMNIVDLGLVREVDANDDQVTIRMTMTSPACPLGDAIERDVREAVGAVVPEGTPISVEFVWDPPWEPSRMSPAARVRFGWKKG